MRAVNTAMLFPRFAAAAVVWALACPLALADAATAPVSFKKDIAPLLQRRCVACHGEESTKGGYRLDTFARLSKAGDSEMAALTPAKPDASELYRLLIEPDPHDRMPQKADALPAGEIALIKRWIEQGAANDGSGNDRPLAELTRESLLLPAPEKYARPIPVTALAFSPDGTQLAASGYYEVTLWNVETGALVRRIGGLPERITSLAWHPKTKLIAVGGGTPAQWGTVALIDPAADFQTRFLCDLPEMALSVAFNPDGTQLAAGSGDRTIRFFDVKNRRQTRVVRPHADWVQSIAYSADGAHLLSASRDRTVRVASTAAGEIEATYTGHETATLAAIFSRDGKTAFSVAQASPLHVWDASSGKRKTEKPLPIPGRPNHLAWLGVDFVAAGADGLVRVYQFNDEQLARTLHGHRDAITSLAVSRAPGVFATGSYDGTVCVWNSACDTWVQKFIASPR